MVEKKPASPDYVFIQAQLMKVFFSQEPRELYRYTQRDIIIYLKNKV